MQVKCPRKELYEAMQVVGQAIPTRSNLPILMHCLLIAEDDKLTIVGTDLEIWIERSIPIIVSEPGRATVPNKVVTDILSSLPDGNVTLETTDDQSTQITLGTSKYNAQGFNPEEYPEMPELTTTSNISVPAELLKTMTEQVGYAASKDESRAVLTGILMHYEGDILRLVATDTHRLAMRESALDGEVENPINAVIPERAVSILTKIPTNEKSSINMAFGSNRAVFELDGTRLLTLLIEGSFPNYQRVIPVTYTRRWVIAKEDLNQAVKRAAIIAKGTTNRIIFSTEGEKVIISAKSEIGNAHEEVDVAREGDDLSLAFNAKYVLDVLGAMDSEGIAIESTETLRPVLMKPVGEQPNYYCVIMPMSINLTDEA